MSDDSPLDPSTGLLHRSAFLKEVRKAQSSVPGKVRRGCLLILHFPGLLSIAETVSVEAADRTLRDLLAIVEMRLRSRDTLGRIAQHSLCLLLRQCRETDAIILAEQYGALLRGGVLDESQQRAVKGLHYRIVPLDPGGRSSSARRAREVNSSALDDTSLLLSAISSLNPSAESPDNNVVALNSEQDSSANNAAAAIQQSAPAALNVGANTASLANQGWRLKPGMLLNHKLLVCSHRIQSVGNTPTGESLSTNPILNAALDCLALNLDNTRPALETQLIVPVDAALLNDKAVDWLTDRCRSQRVAPSDICLALTVESVSRDLRACMPVLRRLNRQGIRLMLEGVSSAPQWSALFKLAAFDYLWISAKYLQESMHNARQRQELHALIAEAHVQHREVCASGIDTQALLNHAQSLQVDIGFGRKCGKSEPFPDLQALSARPAL